MRINAADAAYIDLVDALVSSTHCQDIINKIVSTPLGKQAHETVTEIINAFAVFEEITRLRLYRDSIEEAFSQMSIEAIMVHLKKYKSEWHEQALAAFANKSPSSLKVTLTQCLQMEYAMANHFLQQHDFYEGIRALLIDKDKQPKWVPSTLDKVSREMVEAFFETDHSKPELILI